MIPTAASLVLFASLAYAQNVGARRTYNDIIYLNGRHRDGIRGRPSPLDQWSNVRTEWFEQKLDHFGPNLVTWKQKYFVNDRFYKPGGPAFLMIGGEGPESPQWADQLAEGTPDWMKNAETFGAMAFILEHRYYGDSRPTPDYSTENLRWLSSRQALADIADFIDAMNVKYKLSKAKWITFGGSYSGALSAWFRLKYPHLVAGAVATSGPVLSKVNFEEYLGVVRDSLTSYHPMCVKNVQAATDKVEASLATAEGRRMLQEKLRLCTPIDSSKIEDVASLMATLAGNFMGVVQYSQDNRGNYANKLTIPVVCDIMLNVSIGEPFERYAAVNQLILDTNHVQCVNYDYWSIIAYLQETHEWGSIMRQWFYQSCTEFGYFQSSDLANQPFGHKFPIEFWVKGCRDLFGDKFDKNFVYSAINETNTYYGALNLQATNVVLPNGSLDPWHALGILWNISPTNRAEYIKGTAHCADMYPPRSADLPALTAARREITDQIAAWLR